MTTTYSRHLLKSVGDAVWVALALLHQANPNRDSFSVSEIVDKVKSESLTDKEDVTIYLHANQHCVANRAPNPARLRMLVDLGNSQRRLFCPGDAFDGNRNGRITPDCADLPDIYKPLLDWYGFWSAQRRHSSLANDPLLALRGTGKVIWSNEHADDYINNLRRENV